MSKDTTDELEDSIKHCFYTYNMDTRAGGMDEEKALNYQVDAIKALISNREKLLLDRVEKEVLNDVEVRADQTDVIDDIEDWLQGGGIPPSYDYGRIHVLANERHKVLRRKLATLRKELDGGQSDE